MKRPEYVAGAVNACRVALDGGTPDLISLKNVFSRSGFTSGYFDDDFKICRVSALKTMLHRQRPRCFPL